MTEWESESRQKINHILFSMGMPLKSINEAIELLHEDKKAEIKKAFIDGYGEDIDLIELDVFKSRGIK